MQFALSYEASMKFGRQLALMGMLVMVFSFSRIHLICGKELLYVEKLFNLRDEITLQGNILPEKIQKTEGIDRRTLERIFELNTSTLTTIEAYFRILMITIATENENNLSAIKILNEWLIFTKNQCKYDMEYLNSTLNETTDQVVIDEINITKNSLVLLEQIANSAIIENSLTSQQPSAPSTPK